MQCAKYFTRMNFHHASFSLFVEQKEIALYFENCPIQFRYVPIANSWTNHVQTIQWAFLWRMTNSSRHVVGQMQCATIFADRHVALSRILVSSASRLRRIQSWRHDWDACNHDVTIETHSIMTRSTDGNRSGTSITRIYLRWKIKRVFASLDATMTMTNAWSRPGDRRSVCSVVFPYTSIGVRRSRFRNTSKSV